MVDTQIPKWKRAAKGISFNFAGCYFLEKEIVIKGRWSAKELTLSIYAWREQISSKLVV